MINDEKALILGLALKYCINHGMQRVEILNLFDADRIDQALDILLKGYAP